MNQPQDPAAGQPTQEQLTLRRLTELLGDLPEYEADTEIQLVELGTGQTLFEQGDDGDSMYVLLAGALGVRVRHEDGTESVVDKLAPGAMVGEMALLSGQKRSATVYAVNDAGLLRLTKSKFQEMTGEDQGALAAIDAAVVPRWQRLQLATALRGLFGELDAASLQALQEQAEWQHYSNGSVLFRQGDRADCMYVVVNGRLRVTAVTPDNKEKRIAEIEPGQTVGEFALLTSEPRTATVHAVRETNVLRITPELFRRLVGEHPELMGNVTRIIVERRQRALKQSKPLAQRTLACALVPATPAIDVWHFAQELAAELSPQGETLVLNSQQFDEAYGQPGASQTEPNDTAAMAIVAWLDEMETKHNYLLYAADATPSPWTRRCIGQADRVLIVADAGEDPAPGPNELLVQQLEVPVRTELVLWHPAGTQRPTGTSAWLDSRQVRALHHVRRGDQGHMGSLARRLTGRAVAPVFSSGGARGYAHAGVYRALLELGIPLDYVGGTSMGAMIAGLCALDLSYEELLDLAQEFASPRKIFDRTLPLTSMMASRKVSNICRKIFGDLRIEDLWRPYFCVSTNLSRAEPVVHRRGPMWRAIRASLSIPGVFAPVNEDGELLVDGGIMDTFPVGVMADFSESCCVIGVHVSQHQNRKRQYDMDTSISGWRVLFSRINPFSRALRSPSLIGTMFLSTEVSSKYHAKAAENLVELMIVPDVGRYGVMDYGSYESIAQAGYEAALEPLRAWRDADDMRGH